MISKTVVPDQASDVQKLCTGVNFIVLGSALMASTMFVEVLPDPLELNKYVGFVEDNGSGAIATFMGVTRDNFDGKKVLSLSYEAYVPMAEKEMQVSACKSRQNSTIPMSHESFISTTFSLLERCGNSTGNLQKSAR